MRCLMLSAVQALKLGTNNLDLDRMLKIAEAKVKEAVKEKRESCCILFPKQVYSKLDFRNFKNEASKLGYLWFDAGNDQGNSYCIELSW